MGQLTGGVAHDFNNLLSPIIGGLDLLQRRKLGDERIERMIGGALASAERAKTLVQRLLAFARRQPLQPTAIDVRRLVEGMAGLLASTIGPRIRLVIDVAEALPAARGDDNQVEMALLNLAVNARDAMPDGGEMRIGASLERVSRPTPGGPGRGEHIRLTVADTGVGMDSATLARAVEPFFSTKGIGKGTGLGLSMVHGLAAQLGGAMTIDSQPGEGTLVALWLPLADSAPAPVPAEPEGEAGRHTGRALVVDDEALVRASTADMLADLGYAVVEAGSGAEALALLAAGEEIDLLVTDHLMNGMTGVELAEQVRTLKPEAKLLVVSGYAEVEGIAPDLPRLTKPFRLADLALALE
jgi:CheY-like chemotaxis protein